MTRTTRRALRLVLALAVTAGLVAVVRAPVDAQAGGCTPPAASNFANAGPFQVTTQTDAVTTFYSPAQLGSNGCTRHPVILWGNGTITAPSWYDGLLRHWASHGFIVAAANTSNAGTGQEMLQGLDTLTERNGASGDRFYQKVDLERVSTSGHSQGAAGAIRAAQDQRIDVTFPIQGGASPPPRGPFISFSGENDTLKTGNRTAYNAATNIPAAYAEAAGASHLEPLGNGGAFRGASTAWARWHLMGDTTARSQFVGSNCGLCDSSEWAVYEANPRLQELGGGDPGTTTTTQPGGGGQCLEATNSAHVQAGRATSFLIFAFADGSGDYLGLTWSTTSLRQSGNAWELVEAC
jgi:Chlorophyllase enzyme